MSKWRPDNWSPTELFAKTPVYTSGVDYIEMGADAMIDALFELAKKSPTGTFTIDSTVISIYKE